MDSVRLWSGRWESKPTSEAWESCCFKFKSNTEALDQLRTKTPAFCGPESALDSARAIESTRFMVRAVGIELLFNFVGTKLQPRRSLLRSSGEVTGNWRNLAPFGSNSFG
jgi:hypothetical protein